jgi:hypothetical protein
MLAAMAALQKKEKGFSCEHCGIHQAMDFISESGQITFLYWRIGYMIFYVLVGQKIGLYSRAAKPLS